MMATSLAILPGCRESTTEDTFTPCGTDALTWENWADPFFTGWCNQCHAADAPNRFNAPEDAVFDTMNDVRERIDAIRFTVLEYGSMPLGGGLSNDDLENLDLFLSCLETVQ